MGSEENKTEWEPGYPELTLTYNPNLSRSAGITAKMRTRDGDGWKEEEIWDYWCETWGGALVIFEGIANFLDSMNIHFYQLSKFEPHQSPKTELEGAEV